MKPVESKPRCLEVDANFAQAYNDISLVYAQKGMYRETVQATLKAAALSGTSPTHSHIRSGHAIRSGLELANAETSIWSRPTVAARSSSDRP
jgi:hypothetical protein